MLCGLGRKAVRFAPFVVVLGFLGALAGCLDTTPVSKILVSIEVTPSTAQTAVGTTTQFAATGTFGDDSERDVTAEVTWSSTDAAAATISNTAGSQGLATAAAVGTTTIVATSGSVTAGATLTVTPVELVSIEVTPAASSVANGVTLQFTATGVYSDHSTQDLTAQATWASSNTIAAAVSNLPGSIGLATATGVGTTSISATSGPVIGSTTLTVTSAVLVSIEVTPATLSIANGVTQQFTATGVFSDHSTQDLTAQVTWASSNTAAAAVSNDAGSIGLATATGVGTTTISATSGGVSGSTTLTVTPTVLVSIEVTPADPSIANGVTQQFTATGVFSDHSTQDLTAQITWGSSDGAVATVSNTAGSNGLATTTGVGTTTIDATSFTAISGVVIGSTTLTVTAAELVSIEVTPADPSVANGLTQQFTATGLYTDGSTQDLTTQLTWASSDSAVATVSNAAGSNGLATTAGTGATTITATSGEVTASTTLTVTSAELVSIEVAPADPSVANGLTQQFTATGLYTDGSTQGLTTQLTWASSDSTVATVSNAAGSNGLATTAGTGATTITATSGEVTASTTLTVTSAELVSIEVAPADPSVANGLTQQFTATGLYTDGSTQDLTVQVTWSSSDSTVATVSNAAGSNGLATTAGVGTTTIDATGGEVSGSTTLNVTPATP